MTDAQRYLTQLSEQELVLYWDLFHEYPTRIREQRARLVKCVVRSERLRRQVIARERRERARLMITPPRLDSPRVASIAARVGDFYNVTIDEMKGRSRLQSVAFPRQVAMYMARRHTRCSFEEIGDFFGRDHTTVLYGFNHVAALVKRDKGTRNDIGYLNRAMAGLAEKAA